MSSTFIEHSPKADEDNSLILIMDRDGNVTADPAHFEKLIGNQKLPDMGIKIVRLDSSQNENDSNGDNGSKQELKLTVEEIYPENLNLGTSDNSVNLMSTPLEILPGPSNEHISHDMVDPFSQMDPEQLQRLEHALASEQAKQILGENVAAMLDMLSVEDSPAAFLQNSIKNDHCYTNLLPSSDPNGPSFFVSDNRTDLSKGKGKAKVGTPIKGRRIVPNVLGSSKSIVKKTILKDGKSANKVLQQTKQTTLADYGMLINTTQVKNEEKDEDFSYEENVEVEDSEETAGEEDDNLSDEDYNNKSSRTKRKPRKNKRKVLIKGATFSKSFGSAVIKAGSRFGRRSTTTPEIRARNEKLNDAMFKVVQSMSYPEKEVEDGSDSKKGMKKIKTLKSKAINDEKCGEKEKEKESLKMEEEPSSTEKIQHAKYPKRENRKPPAHLAEAFGPALFSAPDIIRRVSTGEEIQTTPEKKNFTVGVHSNAKTGERKINKSAPNKIESSTSESSAITSKTKTKISPKEPLKEVKPSKTDAKEIKTVKISSGEEISVVKPNETDITCKKTNLEIQKLIEKHQVKPALYEEDQDYSDENIDENYYLDPTQMDQSLLEGFGQSVNKSEDQLLQEALLLQEQLIETNKGIVISETGNVGLEESQVQIPFDTETIEDIQNEITSAILVAHHGNTGEGNQNSQFEEEGKVHAEFLKKKENLKSQSESYQDGLDGGALIVDESKPEDRRRSSAKRRRSDEVSDLDSDMDDALSEASWNSEDDPDRLWCICRKPHNNRFMICCDVCEEWFHGKCVGITKTIGKQMEQDGLEWSCPSCTKKKKVEEHDREAEKIKLLKEKMAQSIKEQQIQIKESQKLKNQNLKEKSIKSPKLSGTSNLKQMKISDFSHISNHASEEDEIPGRKCIMCKGLVRENSIYCSDDCIRKHSQHAISQLMSDGNKKPNDTTGGENSKLIQKVRKEESRIVVMDPNSKKFLIGQNAPTAANLTTWLKENPSYHVVYKKSDKPGKILLTSREVVKIQPKPGESQKVFVQAHKVGNTIKSAQLKLAVNPNSKQINILQPAVTTASGKKVYQLVNSTSPIGKQTAFVVKPKQTEVIEALPFPVKTALTKGAPIKVKDSTPTKAVQIGGGKETVLQKSEKIQKKRKERAQKSTANIVAGKDSKMGQSSKQDETKDKEKDKKDADQQIRDSVKKTLAETLKARVHECKEMEYNEDVIDGLAVKIEEKLFKHFENKVDTKYKSKYRSLVFNIKDPKNETLFRKIIDNSISPKELVKLSPEELASQELARWREKENQHQLEMIKKTELELMTKGNTYIMKSHKGEQVIESDQSEKVAAVAAEIDPNTPAQELVSALNSVTSTTQDANDDEEKNKGNLETSLMKIKKKEKERRRSKERKHNKRDRDKRRSSSRSNHSKSHHSKNKKRSRSRDKDKEKTKHRHKDKKAEKKKEKDSKEEPEVAEIKNLEKSEKKNFLEEPESTTTNKKSVEDDDADREPSSTVIIKTPDINVEEPEPVHLWKGTIVMTDVAKFSGIATEISGDCGGLSIDIGEKVDVVGRISFDTVWHYIARMKGMATKDILVIKIVPSSEEEKASYATLYSYLWKRSRIGVIGKTSDAVKDFYLYPLPSHSRLPQVLLPLDGPPFEGDRENIILGIIVRNKHRSRHLGVTPSENSHTSKVMKKVSLTEDENSSVPDVVPDRSYTPPLPDKEHNDLLKKERQKRKIRVRMDFKEISSKNDEEEELVEEDDDSPYSPGDSDEDLPPLSKIPKPSIPNISNSISTLLSSRLPPTSTESDLQDPKEIQKKIDEMNRAIEEQTQQIQSLTSAVPKLSAETVLPTLPLLANVTSAILTPTLSPNNFSVTNSVSPLPPTNTPPANKPQAPVAEKIQLPLISSELDDASCSPPRSFTPPLKVEENIPFLPEVTSKISLPSNLQEILNSIQKKSGAEESDGNTKEAEKSSVSEEIVKAEDPNIKMALNMLNHTKSLLNNLPTIPKSPKAMDVDEKEEKSGEFLPLLSRLTDHELLQKAKEMEMEVSSEEASLLNSINPPCPTQLLPPGVQDIPLLPPTGFANPPPPVSFFSKPFLSPALGRTAEDKKPDKKIKLDPKAVFENEGVPDFVKIPASGWEDKKGQKAKSYKIDIKLAMNSLEKKAIDMDHFDIESISKMSDVRTMGLEERPSMPSSSGLSTKISDDTRYAVEERILPKADDKYRNPHERDRRRSDDREINRDWKYRRHWDKDKKYKDDYRRHGGGRMRPKFRKDRFDYKASRHLQKEWDGSIKNFEERQRWKNQEIRREELRRSRKRADSSSN